MAPSTAKVLTHMGQNPAGVYTAKALKEATGLSTASISNALTALWEADNVTAEKVGRSYQYKLTRTGKAAARKALKKAEKQAAA
jgi:DNA-binding MarR family transcriptional regulator